MPQKILPAFGPPAPSFSTSPAAGQPSEARIAQALRATRLRPTTARIEVLRVLQNCTPQSLCAAGVIRQMAESGASVSLGTVYRVLQELASRGLLLRECDANGTAQYRIKPAEDHPPLRLQCRRSGRVLVLGDATLRAQVLESAARAGWNLAGRELVIQAG